MRPHIPDTDANFCLIKMPRKWSSQPVRRTDILSLPSHTYSTFQRIPHCFFFVFSFIISSIGTCSTRGIKFFTNVEKEKKNYFKLNRKGFEIHRFFRCSFSLNNNIAHDFIQFHSCVERERHPPGESERAREEGRKREREGGGRVGEDGMRFPSHGMPIFYTILVFSLRAVTGSWELSERINTYFVSVFRYFFFYYFPLYKNVRPNASYIFFFPVRSIPSAWSARFY